MLNKNVIHKWSPGTIVQAVVTNTNDCLEEGNLYMIGHLQGMFTPEQEPCYWVVCDDGVSRPIWETAFVRANIKVKR